MEITVTKKNIIWTRSLADWEEDQKLWDGADVVWHWPLLAHQAKPATLPDWEPQTLLVTSKKGLHFARQVPELLKLMERKVPIMTFGKQTWQAIKDCGYFAIRMQAPDGAGFVKKILACYPPLRAYYLCSTQPASPLDKVLNKQGWQVSPVVVYEAIHEKRQPTAELYAELQSKKMIICFASPSAVRAFASWRESATDIKLHSIQAVSIGASTAQTCEEYQIDSVVIPESDLGLLWQTAKELADS